MREYRIINVYRSFVTYDNDRPIDKFQNQLSIISNALNESPAKIPIILGDFNLDYNRIYQSNYNFSTLYEHLLAVFDPLGLIQLVNFETWSRFVQQIKKSSILDHIYSKDPELIRDLQPIDTEIGDHKF